MADLINVAELRGVLGTDPSKDREFLRLLPQVYSLLERTTNRLWLFREDHEQVFTPENRAGDLRLALNPVISVGTVEEWMGIDGESSAETVDTTDYAFNPETGRLTRFVAHAGDFLRDGPLSQDVLWYDYVKVTYTGGYTATTCPPDVQHAIELQVKFMMERWQSSNVSVESKSVDKSSTRFITKTLHPVFEDTCIYYRRKYA